MRGGCSTTRSAPSTCRCRPDDVATHVASLRIFRGYAGWTSGQLDAEVSLGAWMVFDARHDDIFTSDPVNLWRRVLRRQGGRLAWIANAPSDLSAN
jgi:putative transcriptional regulator